MSKRSGRKPQPNPNNHSGDKQERSITGSVHVQGEIEVHLPPDIKKENPADTKKKEARETIKLWIEGLSLFFLIVYAGLTGIQARQSIRSADAAKDAATAATNASQTAATQLELAERPWVDASVMLDGPFDFNVNGANIHLKVMLRNTGNSPAESTNISYLGLIGKQGVDAAAYRDQVCKDAAKLTTSMPLGITLFPKVDFEQQESIGIGAEAIERGKDSTEFPTAHLPNDIFDYPTVVICVAYRPTFNRTSIYHTAYIFDLMHSKPFNGHGGVTFKVGEDVPVDYLLWRIHWGNPVFAD